MKKYLILFISILSAVSFCSCKNASVSNKTSSSVSSREIFAMDTYMTVTAYGENSEVAVSDSINEIQRIDALLSVGNPDSEIYKLNTSGSGKLSSDSSYLLARSIDLNKSTDGLYNIAIYPLMNAWGFTSGDYRVPTDSEIQDLLTTISVADISFDSKTGQVDFLTSGMSVDFGGIAKGYTSSKIMSLFNEYGIESGLVSLGGNVQLLGHKPDGTDWKVGIQSPDDSSEYFGVLSASDVAVITSGGYERFFEENGTSYHHIIDPRTGYPADSGLKSVTIVSKDGTLADGLSTSIFIMGLDASIEYWRSHSEEFDMILLTSDNTLYVTENLIGSFSSSYEINEIVL